MKKMLRSLAILCALSLALHAQSATPPARQTLPREVLSLAINQTVSLKVPFAITDYSTSNENAKLKDVNGSAFQIVGIANGTCAVTVSSNNLTKTYQVTVTGSALPLYHELTTLLTDIPEISVTLRDDTVTLRGEISSVNHWNRFKRLTAPYTSRFSNFVTFQPSPEMFEELKRELTAAGYTLANAVSPDKPGQLKFDVDPGMLTISGYVLCDHDIKNIQSILDAQKWLSPQWNGGFFEAKTLLTVADTQLDIGIVFVGITRSQMEFIGNTAAEGTILSWDVIGWFNGLSHAALPGSTNQSSGHGAFTQVNANLTGTLKMFNSNGVSDFRDAGHITITNNSQEFGSYENGGTLNVKVEGSENSDLEPIEFGLKLKVRGSLVRADVVRLTLDLEKSLAPTKSDEDYFQRSTKSKTELLCCLDKTAVIAGQKELSYSDNGPAGHTGLRHWPILKWFFSNQESRGDELQMLILVCPQLSVPKATMSSIPSSDTAPTEREVSERVKEKEQRVINHEKSPLSHKLFSK